MMQMRSGGCEAAAVSEDGANRAVERSRFYGLLANLFRAEPSSEILNRLRASDMRAVLQAAGVELGDAFFQTPVETLVEKLAVEFTRLFLGPTGHILPYESVQVPGGSGILHGPETSMVRNYIESAGFQYHEQCDDIPDHISVELEFLSHLTQLEAQACEEGNMEKLRNCVAFEADFLKRHLGRWVYRFLDLVTERAELSLYRETAQLAAAFLRDEQRIVTRNHLSFA